MGRKSNPEWREKNAKRLAAQRRCVLCGQLNNPRYLVSTERGLAHRRCAKAATMEPEEILEWKRKADDYEVRTRPPTWAVLWAEREIEERRQREKDRQAHLSIRNYWLEGPPSPEAAETPGSGVYNAKHGFER